MKKTVKITEQQLISMIKEGVENVLQVVNEHKASKGGYNIYVGNDISYERAYEQAEEALYKAQNENYQINSVLDLIEYQGWKSQSFNQEDWETLYDANEDAFTTILGKKKSPHKKINESGPSIKSPKLLSLIKQHGGISKDGHRVNADLHNLTDNDVLGVVRQSDIDNYRKDREVARKFIHNNPDKYVSGVDDINFLHFNDGFAVALISKGLNNDTYNTWGLRQSRWSNKPNDNKEYDWHSSETAQDVFRKRRPYWQDYSPETKKYYLDKIDQEREANKNNQE